jgi:hypothetical protein
MKNLTNHTSRIAAAFLVLTCCAPSNLTAVTPPLKDLLMSFNETLDSESTLDGDIKLTGAFNERGTRHEDFTVVSVNEDGSQIVIKGTSTITTASGTVTTKFTGTIYFDLATFDSTLLAYVQGTETVTGGTGAYAGAAGRGTFGATLDYTNNNVIGVFAAKVLIN